MAETPKAFDPKTAARLEEEYGDWRAALSIASAEMEGAYETPNGVNALQTACHQLHYRESLPPSPGQLEGKHATTTALADFLAASGYSSVEDWIKANS
jgi:hypothetical protein